MENNNELSPPELEQPSTEVTTAPEPSKPSHSPDEFFERMEEAGIAEEVTASVAREGEEHPTSGTPKDTSIKSEYAVVRQVEEAVQRLNNDKAEFAQACAEIERMYAEHSITDAQYQQAIANAREMSISLREGELQNQAVVGKLQAHYKTMVENLQQKFPEEWSEKNRKVTTDRIYNFAEKHGVPRQLITEIAETPQALPFLTAMIKLDAENKRLKQEAIKRNTNKQVPMANKVANLASQSAKRQQTQNANVGYFGSKESQNSQLDAIDKILRSR